MRKNIFVSLCFLFILMSAYSQSNFKNGYIVTNQNDTISGLIDFRTDLTNSLICRFRLTEQDSDRIYKPGEIESYRLVNEGKYYVSKNVLIDSIQQTVFLEFLVKGIKNLYYLSKDYGYYFFEEKDGTLIGMTQIPERIINNEHIVADNRFKGKMTYVFRDYMPLALKTTNAKFEKKSMIEFTKTYHDKMCDSGEKCIVFENDYKKKYSKLGFIMYSGMEFTTLKFDKYFFNEINSISPILGGEFEISSPRFLRSLYFTLNANFSQVNAESEYGSDESRYYYNYKYSAIKTNFSAGIKYTFDRGLFRPSFEVDLIQNNLFDLKSELRTDFLEYDNNIYSFTKENELLPDNKYLVLAAGIGFDFLLPEKHFIVVKILYMSNSKKSNLYNLDKFKSNETLQLKLGYKF